MKESAEVCNSSLDETRMSGLKESCSEDPLTSADASHDGRDSIGLLLEIQRDMAIGLLPCVTLPDCLNLLLESALRLPGFDCGGIYLCDEKSGELRLISQRGLSEAFVERSAHYPADSAQARLLREGRLIYAIRSDLPREVAEAIRSEGLEALAIVPVMDHDRLVAAVNVSSHRHHRIGQESRIALESLVAQVEVAMFSINEREARHVAERTAGLEAVIGALRVSEQKYRNLHESMSDAIAGVDMSGRIIESNCAFQEMMGYTAEELKHLSYYEITPERWHSMEAEMAVSAEFYARGYSELYEKEYRRKDGTVFPVELRAFLIRDAAGDPALIWAIIRDITQRKQAEESVIKWNQNLERRVAERTVELVQSEARFRQLTEATFEGVAISEAGILIDGNPQLARIYQCDLDDMIGRPVLDFVAPESRDLVTRRIRGTRETTYECIGLRPDGTKFPQEVHGSTRVWQGREIRVTALRDLTEAKQVAARFQFLQTELEHAQRFGLVSEISAGIVHQIGQPLCAMGANVSVAASVLRGRDPSISEVLEIVEDIEADIVRIREAVVHLRALANPANATRVRIEFNDMISDVIGLVSQEAARRLIDLEVDCRGDLPPIEGDSVQLSQVALNLIHNAFDACGDGSRDRCRVRVVTRPADGGGVELEVSDSGPGIAPAAMAGLFAPFFTTKRDGLGMGLRLCHTIVRAHGGTIEGANRPDRPGAVFRVTLPVTPDVIHATV